MHLPPYPNDAVYCGAELRKGDKVPRVGCACWHQCSHVGGSFPRPYEEPLERGRRADPYAMTMLFACLSLRHLTSGRISPVLRVVGCRGGRGCCPRCAAPASTAPAASAAPAAAAVRAALRCLASSCGDTPRSSGAAGVAECVVAPWAARGAEAASRRRVQM